MKENSDQQEMMASFVAVGDLMLGDSPLAAGYGWRSAYRRDSALLALEGLRPALEGADIAFGNLEVQLTETGIGRTRMARNMMRGDPEYATILRNLGFNVLAVANNHAMQHGERAFAETVRTLRRAGIAVAGLRGSDGWHAEPVLKIVRSGMSVGLLAYSLRPRQYGAGVPSYADGPELAILEDVARLRQEVDRTIVSLHWGDEFTQQPSTTDVDFARRLSDLGVNLVVGHHPHVLRPVVMMNRCVVAYSLGNAVSDMVWQPQFRDGLALRCEMSRTSQRVSALRLHTDRSYVVKTNGEWDFGALSSDTPGLENEVYQAAINDSMRSYRRAALRHILLNLWRSSPTVTFELLIDKSRNLFNRFLRRTKMM